VRVGPVSPSQMNAELDRQREIEWSVYGVFLRWSLAIFVAASAVLLASLVWYRKLDAVAARGGRWSSIIDYGEALVAGIAAFALVVVLISWFGRQRTLQPDFPSERLQGKYRKVAWSVVGGCVLLFIALVWYTVGHDLARLR
jgi:hypothetical protein